MKSVARYAGVETQALAISFHPRHPSDIREQNKLHVKDRPSILGNNTKIQIIVVIPAIATALAVYMALFFVNRVLSDYAREAGWGTEGAQGGETDVMIRDVDGVVPTPVLLDQPAPPSPERVVEELYRERDEARRAASSVPKPILIPVLEPEQLSVDPIEMAPLGVPETPIPNPGVGATTGGPSNDAGQ